MKGGNILNEKFVKKAIIKWLRECGYGWGLDSKELRERGVDIKVRHKTTQRYYYVETKGDAKPHIRDANFLVALGQIITRMKSKAQDHYAIGFPESYRDLVMRRMPYNICRKLDLKFLFVDKEGKVRKATSMDLKKRQKSRLLPKHR